MIIISTSFKDSKNVQCGISPQRSTQVAAAPSLSAICTDDRKRHRIIIEHPENIAFDTSIEEGTPGWDEFYVLAKRLRVFSSFGKVSSVALADNGELVY